MALICDRFLAPGCGNQKRAEREGQIGYTCPESRGWSPAEGFDLGNVGLQRFAEAQVPPIQFDCELS